MHEKENSQEIISIFRNFSKIIFIIFFVTFGLCATLYADTSKHHKKKDVLTDFLNRYNKENKLKQQQDNITQQNQNSSSLIASLALGSEQQDQPSLSELIDQESHPQPQPDQTNDPIYTLEHDKDLMSMMDGSYIDNNPKQQINEQYQQAKKSLAEILQMPKFNPVSLDDGDSGYYIDQNGQKRHFRMKGYDAIDGQIPDGYSKSQDRMDVQNVAAFYRTGTEPTIENTTDEAMTQMREPLKKEDMNKFANLIGVNIDEKLNEDHSHNVIAQSKDIRYVINNTDSLNRNIIELYDANTGKRINQAMHTDLNGYNINIDKFNKMYQKILDRQTDREEDESKSLLKYTAESVIDAFANTGLYLADKASNVLSDDIHKTVHEFAQKHQDMLTDGIEPKRLQAYDKEFEDNKGILNKLGTVLTHPEETLTYIGIFIILIVIAYFFFKKNSKHSNGCTCHKCGQLNECNNEYCIHCGNIMNNKQYEKKFSENHFKQKCYCISCNSENNCDNKVCVHCGKKLCQYPLLYRQVKDTIEGAYVSLLAKVAKADGHIDRRETEFISKVFDRFLQSSNNADQKKKVYEKIFEQETINKTTIKEICSRLNALASSDAKIVLLHYLLELAHIDGKYDTKEEQIILEIVINLKIDFMVYVEIKNQFDNKKSDRNNSNNQNNLSIKECYNILESKEGDDMNTIKKNYRRLISEYHPDIMASKDLPEGMFKHAEYMTKKINQAYSIIKKIHDK